ARRARPRAVTAVDRARGPDVDALADLEEQRRFLLGSLRDLEQEWAAGDIDEADYRTLRDDYTARAAAVLRAIEDGRAAPAESDAISPAARRRRLRITAAVTLGVLLLAVIAGLAVARSSGERVRGPTLAGVSSGVADKLRRAHELDQQGKALD